MMEITPKLKFLMDCELDQEKHYEWLCMIWRKGQEKIEYAFYYENEKLYQVKKKVYKLIKEKGITDCNVAILAKTPSMIEFFNSYSELIQFIKENNEER
jgi:hypothetical protein